MKHIFIINPAAGQVGAADELRRTLLELGTTYDWEIYDTVSPGDATEYVKKTCQNNPENEYRFYACGGDGTLNEVVNGAVGFPNAQVGCYPCGSGNDFVKVFGGAEKFRNVQALMEGEASRIDLIQVGERYSVNVTNFGFDTCVARTMIQVRRRRILGGKRAYTTGIVKAIFTARKNRCTVEADGEVLNPKGKMLLCTIANGQYVGGSFFCAPRASTSDGLLEVCLVKPVNLFKMLFSLFDKYKKGKHLDDPRFKKCMVYRQAKSVHITAPEGFAYSLDGEIIEENDFYAKIAPGALLFVLPKEAVSPEETPSAEKIAAFAE